MPCKQFNNNILIMKGILYNEAGTGRITWLVQPMPENYFGEGSIILGSHIHIPQNDGVASIVVSHKDADNLTLKEVGMVVEYIVVDEGWEMFQESHYQEWLVARLVEIDKIVENRKKEEAKWGIAGTHGYSGNTNSGYTNTNSGYCTKPITNPITGQKELRYRDGSPMRKVRLADDIEIKPKSNMKVLTQGHRYELANFENKEAKGQEIQFIEKMPYQTNDGTKLLTVNDGTTNEDVIEVLIDRLQYLNEKFPCRENALAITKLEEALFWLNKRTADRVKRNVEGTNQK